MTHFNKQKLKQTVEHLIRESYFRIGNKTMLQTTGIPMGLSPSPFWANLYLHRHEYKYMGNKIKNNIKQAYNFHACMRFIDDLLAINDNNQFGLEFKNIYPEGLDLTCEHTGKHCTFLDLDIEIINGKFQYKLFDKRDEYPFQIIRMPQKKSNIPKNIFYSAIKSEFLRISKTTSNEDDLVRRTIQLMKRMINQGADLNETRNHLKKTIYRHSEYFKKYSTTIEVILYNIIKGVLMK